MPTAKSAAGRQPTSLSSIATRPASSHRVRRVLLGVVLSVAALLPAGLAMAPATLASASSGGTGACQRWTSTTRPPDYIYVYRNKTKRIQKVAFKKYVVTVMGKEWPSYLPQPVVEAGAVAVKQYAWYHALHGPRRTRDGRCFTVKDSTSDQLYKPNRARVRSDHYKATEKTWKIVLIKNDRFFMTGYRRGNKHNCGRDATGWKLFARSATRCAYAGKQYLKILRIYYGPNLTINGETQAVSYRRAE